MSNAGRPWELYLLRHGVAETRSASGADADRHLTPDGIAELRSQLERAAKLGLRPCPILCSPYVRALETAELAADVLECGEPILQSSALTPDSTPQALWAEARIHASGSALLVVSHEPLLSGALAWLQGAAHAPTFAPAGMACLEIQQEGAVPQARLKWMLTPRESIRSA
jgi:phosphohistidine phosphatase